MKKITKFDSAALDTLRRVLDEAVSKALAPYGLTGEVGGIRYDSTNFTASVRVATTDHGRQSYLEVVKYSKQQGRSDSVEARWFGKAFRHRGDEYRIVGGNFGRRQEVETVRVRDGAQYWFPCQLVREAFTAKAA